MSIGILEAVRDELIACEAVGSGRVFCESWLAKDASYIRVLKFHNNPKNYSGFFKLKNHRTVSKNLLL